MPNARCYRYVKAEVEVEVEVAASAAVAAAVDGGRMATATVFDGWSVHHFAISRSAGSEIESDCSPKTRDKRIYISLYI